MYVFLREAVEKKKQTIDQNMKRKWKEALSMCLPEVWYSFYSVDGKQVRMNIKKATLKTNEQVLVEMMFLHQQHWQKKSGEMSYTEKKLWKMQWFLAKT